MQDLLQRLLLAGGGGFSPSSLFAGGVAGAFYDPSDLSTLFQDSAGTTPVTGVEQVVGLMLDKSQNLLLGPELFSTFGTVTAPWTAQGGGVWSIDGSQIANRDLSAPSIFTINTFYTITFTLSGVTGGTVSVFAGEGSGTSLGNGTYTFRRAATQTYFIFRAPAGVAATVSGVSVKQVLGNHATSTGSARPTLSARVNLLTKTEEINDAAWTKVISTVASNSTTAPDGTLTADTLIPNAVTGLPYVQQTLTTVSGVNYTWSIYLKPAGYNWVFLDAFDGSNHRTWFDLSGGTVGTVEAGNTSTITAVGNGWYRCTLTRSIGAVSTAFAVAIVSGNNALNITANGTDGVYVWGGDVRVANDGVNIPAYQRVNTATDYDTNGFPFYLSFGGAQSMSTPGNIDFATVTSDGQARRNIVTNPSLFNASGWAVTALAVTANATTAPDGSSSAYRLAEDSATSAHSLYQSIGTLTGTYTASAYVKPNGRTWCYMEPTGSGSTRTWFDLSGSGTVGTVGASVTAAIVALANGWYRISTTFTYPTSNAVVVVGLATGNNNVNYTGDGTSGVFLWGAQLETGSTATAFQNIGTDQMTVYAGVRKLSDAARGIVTELSNAISPNPGNFNLSAPVGASASFAYRSSGTLDAFADATTGYAAPITGVLTGVSNIGGDSAALRVNGTQAALSTADQGTGNYGTYPLFIGARNNASLFLNGRIYSLIVQGTTASATQLASTEAYVNQKTKAY